MEPPGKGYVMLGDLLSPMLFIITMEVLNAMIAEAERRLVLSPLPGSIIRYRVSLYADDLVIVFVLPNRADLAALRGCSIFSLGLQGYSQMPVVPHKLAPRKT